MRCAGLIWLWVASQLAACASSHGLMQTAHTQPAASWRAKLGVASVFNANDDAPGRDMRKQSTIEPSLRVGLHEQVDVGLAPWYTTGGALDGKVNLLDNHGRLALAPRLVAGYAWGEARSVVGLEVGVIASYHFQPWFEPYIALGFANHWFSSRNMDETMRLAPNQRFAPKQGCGDGLVKLTAGVDIQLAGAGWHLLAEYAHWFRAQDDPGDGFSFVANDIVALSVAFHASGS